MIYQKILLPIDGSLPATAGLQEVLKISNDRPREIMLIHVVEVPHWNQKFDEGTVGATIVDSYREEGQKILTTGRQMLSRDGVVVQETLSESRGQRAAELILSFAQAWGADLIVMGTHGRRGISRAILGSDAADVVRGSVCPVLLVRGTDPG